MTPDQEREWLENYYKQLTIFVEGMRSDFINLLEEKKRIEAILKKEKTK